MPATRNFKSNMAFTFFQGKDTPREIFQKGRFAASTAALRSSTITETFVPGKLSIRA